MNTSEKIKIISEYSQNISVLHGIFLLLSVTLYQDTQAREVPGWGNAALVCDTPRVENDSPDLNFGGGKNSFETGYYHIGRLPDPANRFLDVAEDGTVRLFPSETQSPFSWLVTGVGANLYQISICYKGQPRCLILSDDHKMELGKCAYEAFGTQAWWNVGILVGSGKGGWELGSNGVGRMECLTENNDFGVPYLVPCSPDKPDITWRIEPANSPSSSSSVAETQQTENNLSQPVFPDGADVITYQCESGQIVNAFYDYEGGQMQVSYKGRRLKLDPLMSGSGAKFGGENVPWGGGQKVSMGAVFSYTAGGVEGSVIEQCKETEAIQDTSHASDQNREPTLAPNREWMATGYLEEVVLTDCHNCGDDIGMIVACQGAENPALVSLNWAATESASPATLLTIEVDGQTFERSVSTVNNGMLGQVPQFNLQRNDPLIDALNKGNVAKINFGNVRTQIGLRGSKNAFEIFNVHCGWNQPIENTTQVSPPMKKTEHSEAGSDNPASENPNGAIWHTSEYFDDQKNRSVRDLIFGIPETDAIALIASCDARTTTAELDLLLDTGNLKPGTPYYVRLQTGDFDQTYKAQVFFDNSEYSGVKLSLPASSPFWGSLSAGETLFIVPQSGNELELKHSASVKAVQVWLNQCKN